MAAVVVVAVAGWCAHAQRHAASLEDRWDATREVVVARHDLSAGESVTGDDLTSQRRPSALVPHGALREVPGASSLATTDIPGGEVIIADRLVDAAERSSVPPGRAAVEVTVSHAVPAVRIGDRVDLLATAPVVDPFTAASPFAVAPEEVDRGGPGAVVVARDALVLDDVADRDTESLAVAVRDADVAATAAASLAGPVAVVRRPGGD